MAARWVLSVFVVFCALPLDAVAQRQGQVVGVVRDAETNEILIGVSIYVERLQKGTTTDEMGRYELELPEGEHHLRVSYVGYRTLKKRISITGQPLTLDLGLQLESEKLSEVEVTSESKDRNVTELEMSVETLDMITIKKMPAP